MKVFVAGASGAIGKRLVPQLVAQGHSVAAMIRTSQHADALRMAGAEPVVADALDPAAVIEAVKRAEPEVIIHQLTALTSAKDYKHFDDDFALTNRLRTEGTDSLMEAARQTGVKIFIAQSYGNWNYERTGSAVKTENDPLDPAPPEHQQESMRAIKHVERVVTTEPSLKGVALRYGNLYGPGTGFSVHGDIVASVRKRALPIVGGGAGVWSFIHVDDAAAAAVAAMMHGETGIYNIADDEPAPVNVWLPDLALAVGAKSPLHIPVWLGRLIVGDVGVSMMTQVRGASNMKAKRELLWEPTYASWREGFRTGLGA